MMNEISIDELGAKRSDPRVYGRILWRWKWLLLAFLVIIPLATYLYESGRPKVYKSSALLQVSGGQQLGVASLLNQVPIGPDTTDLLADARLIGTAGLAQRAANYLHPRPAQWSSLLGSASASADQTTGFMTITASAGQPQRAAAIANAFAQALVADQTQVAARNINTAIGDLQRQLQALPSRDPGRNQLAAQIDRFRALQAAQNSDVTVLDPATASSSPVAPLVSRSVILALIVALLLGLGAVAIAEAIDRRVRSVDEIDDVVGLPLLSAIPQSAFSGVPSSPESEEAFATLRASLTYFNVDRPISTILVTSPAKEEGKTTVAVRLSQALARAGKNVILVDADLRRPAVASRLGIAPQRGLGSLLAGQVSLEQALVSPTETNGDTGRLRVLPAGSPPPNPSELLSSRRMAELVSELAEQSDIVVIDSTPLLAVSDSMALLRLMSGVLLVARMKRSTRDAVVKLRDVVMSAGGHPLGVIATGAKTSGLYGGSGYGYYSSATSVEESDSASSNGRRKLWRRGGKEQREEVGVAPPE